MKAFNLVNVLWQFGTIVGSDGAGISQCPSGKPQRITLFVISRIVGQMKLELYLVTISKCVDLLRSKVAIRIIYLVKIVNGGLSSSSEPSPYVSDLTPCVADDKPHAEHF